MFFLPERGIWKTLEMSLPIAGPPRKWPGTRTTRGTLSLKIAIKEEKYKTS
jgi:hypothetical protein